MKQYNTGCAQTLDEVALALWNEEGRQGVPLTKQRIAVIEARAMEKCKSYLKGLGIEANELDVLAALEGGF